MEEREDERSAEEVDRQDDDRERTQSLSALNSFFVASFASEQGRHHRIADVEEEEEEEEGLCSACTQC